MSIFDRFVQKEASKPKSDSFSSVSRREVSSLLEAAAREAKDAWPEDSRTVDAFAGFLRSEYRARYKASLDGAMEPMKAEARFFLSDNRMAAYACLFQPENGGEEMTLEEFIADMHYEGLNYGILQEEVARGFKRGYFHIFKVAQGTYPAPGEDGKVVEHFQRQKNVGLEVQNGSQVDFSQDFQIQPVRKGSVICSIQPPKPGTDGVSVTGEVTPCEKPLQPDVPRGKNTILSSDGKALLAWVDGILYMEDGLLCIHEQKIIDGDLTNLQEALEINGNLYIGGDVDGGAAINASGDIVINGKLGRGRVNSMGGTIRVQKGIYGTEGGTFLSAARQVQAPDIEWAEIEAGTSVIAESVLNSKIHCGGTACVMTGRGIIASSDIWAGDSVLCLRIGNQAGGLSRISVGYPPHIPEQWEQLRAELAQAQSTIDMLWKHIIELRNKGQRISDSEKSVLDQFLVQRELYTKRREELMAGLKAVNKELDKKSRGRIRCERINPSLDVQIGRFFEKITTIEEGCNIRVVDNQILMK